MGRLIDSDRLLALIEGMKKSICYQENNTQIAINNIEGMIFSLPTVDKTEWHLNYLPPVTPAPKKCHNENHNYAECDQFVCSNCGIELQDWHRVERDIDTGDIAYHQYEFKYCPNCGAKIDKRTLKYTDQDTMMSAT